MLYNIKYYQNKGEITMSKDVWFVTGASTGLGRALVQYLLTHNCKVVATARRTDDIKKYTNSYSNQNDLMILELNVTDKNQIEDCIKRVLKEWHHIDVIVNNAGYGYFSSVEFAEEKEARNMFEVNFWGVKNILDFILPVMRKQGQGHVINISSLGGLRAFSGFGFYHATKFALEGLTESLQQEVSSLGIEVTLVEPGDFKTDFADRSAVVNQTLNKIYHNTANNNISKLQILSGHQPGDPLKFARAVYKIHQLDKKPVRILLGSDSYTKAKEKYKNMLEDFENNYNLTISTDF